VRQVTRRRQSSVECAPPLPQPLELGDEEVLVRILRHPGSRGWILPEERGGFRRRLQHPRRPRAHLVHVATSLLPPLTRLLELDLSRRRAKELRHARTIARQTS
jgi:hypothetical protein